MQILINGKLHDEKDVSLGLNRAMRYGDGVFETILVRNGNTVYWEDHLIRLKNGLNWLKIQFPLSFEEKLKDEVLKLLLANSIEDSAILRIYAYRSGGGKYAPQANTVEYVAKIESIASESTKQEKGLSIDLADESYIHTSQNYKFKTLNAIPYIRASIEKSNRDIDELILLNEHNRIVEACSSNIFVFLDKMWQTPALEEGCLDGVLRKKIVEYFKKNRIPHKIGFVEKDSLINAEEIILTNSIQGIRWVKSYRNKRYFHSRAEELKKML